MKWVEKLLEPVEDLGLSKLQYNRLAAAVERLSPEQGKELVGVVVAAWKAGVQAQVNVMTSSLSSLATDRNRDYR